MSEPILKLESDRLSIKQVFDSSISTLFECFSKAELLSQWHAPGTMVPTAEVDFRIGGSYRIAMQNEEGQVFTATGNYQTIEAPNKIVYTWKWAEREDPATLVTVLFTELGEKTEVELIHEGFEQAGETEHHSQGWTAIFSRLEIHLNN